MIHALCLVLTTLVFDLPCSDRLFEFRVEDQFESVRTHADVLGTVTVLVWADRDANEWTTAWIDMLDAALRGQVEGGLVGIRRWAHTRGAPFFVKGRIRRSFPEAPEGWVFVDWKGRFAERYAPREEHVNAYVFDREGCLVAHESGREVEATAIARLARAAQDVLIRDLERDPD